MKLKDVKVINKALAGEELTKTEKESIKLVINHFPYETFPSAAQATVRFKSLGYSNSQLDNLRDKVIALVKEDLEERDKKWSFPAAKQAREMFNEKITKLEPEDPPQIYDWAIPEEDWKSSVKKKSVEERLLVLEERFTAIEERLLALEDGGI